MTTAQQVIDFERRYVGTVETGGPHGNDGNLTPFGSWYGWNGVAWCAIFQSYCLAQCGLPMPAQNSKGFASVWYGAEWAKKMGYWHAKGSGPFYAGDLAVFNNYAHIELIAGPLWADGFHTIGGNTTAGPSKNEFNGGGVYERDRNLSEVMGVIRPPYQGAVVAPRPKPVIPVQRRNLMLTTPMMRGDDVKALQNKMRGFGSVAIIADGIFGRQTHDYVVWWQHAMGLVPDGIVGPITWRKFFSR
jgi:hypothetical protein